MKPLRYFSDPINFSYVTDGKEKCDICSAIDICFSESSFYGARKLKNVCCDCLIAGRIQKYGMSGNDVSDVDIALLHGNPKEVQEKIDDVKFKTPKLPTWQDIWWPAHDGDFCVFQKIASKQDFQNKEELYESIRVEDLYDHSADDLWSMLPDGLITNLKTGNYAVSFYLFHSKSKKIVLWDCN